MRKTFFKGRDFFSWRACSKETEEARTAKFEKWKRCGKNDLKCFLLVFFFLLFLVRSKQMKESYICSSMILFLIIHIPRGENHHSRIVLNSWMLLLLAARSTLPAAHTEQTRRRTHAKEQ